MNLMKTLRNLIFHYRLKRAVKRANELHALTGCRYLVILWKSRPLAIQRREMKQWIATRKLRKGITIRDIEQRALYITA